MQKIRPFLLSLTLLVACSGDDGHLPSPSLLEMELANNTSWPYKVVGVLEIVEAGGYDESEYPSFAVGSIVTAGDPDGVLIEIGEGVAADARIDIDSGETVEAWLGAPRNEYGSLFYPVLKIRKQ